MIISSDATRTVAFLGAVSTVAVVTCGLLYERLRRRTTGGLTRLEKIFYPLAVLGIFCVAYGRFVEPYWPEVTHVTVATDKLKAGTRPIRLALISDLHCEPKTRLEDRLPDLISKEKPDAIMFTGDSINRPEGLPVFQGLMKKLSAIAPTFAVRGNWDAWYWDSIELFRDTGALELDGEAVAVPATGGRVWVAGIAVDEERGLPGAQAAIPAGAFSILLYHFPYPDVLGRGRPVDLMLSGHVHGGQVALPYYGAILTLSKYGKQYERGLYDVGAMKLYVSRGVGMEGGSAPPVRFCSRPEITIIDLVPK